MKKIFFSFLISFFLVPNSWSKTQGKLISWDAHNVQFTIPQKWEVKESLQTHLKIQGKGIRLKTGFFNADNSSLENLTHKALHTVKSLREVKIKRKGKMKAKNHAEKFNLIGQGKMNGKNIGFRVVGFRKDKSSAAVYFIFVWPLQNSKMGEITRITAQSISFKF